MYFLLHVHLGVNIIFSIAVVPHRCIYSIIVVSRCLFRWEFREGWGGGGGSQRAECHDISILGSIIKLELSSDRHSNRIIFFRRLPETSPPAVLNCSVDTESLVPFSQTLIFPLSSKETQRHSTALPHSAENRVIPSYSCSWSMRVGHDASLEESERNLHSRVLNFPPMFII